MPKRNESSPKLTTYILNQYFELYTLIFYKDWIMTIFWHLVYHQKLYTGRVTVILVRRLELNRSYSFIKFKIPNDHQSHRHAVELSAIYVLMKDTRHEIWNMRDEGLDLIVVQNWNFMIQVYHQKLNSLAGSSLNKETEST